MEAVVVLLAGVGWCATCLAIAVTWKASRIAKRDGVPILTVLSWLFDPDGPPDA